MRPYRKTPIDVIWISDSPETPSGFGNVTRFVCEGLARRGYRVSILGWQTTQTHEWHGCQVHSIGLHPFGFDALFSLLARVRPQVVAALGDIWWLPYFSAPHIRRQMEMIDAPWLLYFPIDGNMANERLPEGWLELLREVDVPVAMSRYGQRIVQNAGILCEYIPHGVDLDIFSPPPDREAAKARVDAAGKFVVFSDCRNQPRKMIPRLLDVFAEFSKRRPDALLHLHTDPEDLFTATSVYSYSVREDVRHLGLQRSVRFSPAFQVLPGQGLPLEQLASYYQAADVFLLASTGEGFGLPTLQASAAGAVPMAGAYSASRELVEGHGETIEIAAWTENEFGIRGGLIDVNDAAAKLTKFYDNRDMLAERSRQSRAFSQPYGWETLVERWDALLSDIASRRRRITRVTPTKSLSDAKGLSALRVFVPEGVAVRVDFAEREYGRLESSILADRRGRLSDVKIPTVPHASTTDSVKVVRAFGYVGIGGAETVFQRLKAIFPVLSGWNAGTMSFPRFEEARLHLAQSVLLLNLGGVFDTQFLLDAAFFGVPCVGDETNGLQRRLWPELVVVDDDEAVGVARRVLTDAAFAESTVRNAREAIPADERRDDKLVAAWLRRLSAARISETPSGTEA
jgi:glycosyltransferase involved in cell wall biosynthesis